MTFTKEYVQQMRLSLDVMLAQIFSEMNILQDKVDAQNALFKEKNNLIDQQQKVIQAKDVKITELEIKLSNLEDDGEYIDGRGFRKGLDI